MATVRLWAAARQAVGADQLTVRAATLGGVLASLPSSPALDRLLPVCSFLVDGMSGADTSAPLRDDAVVDVLPPFAGG